MSHAFQGAAVIVTGASAGIGEHIARLLAAQGARLVLAARRAEALEAVAAACRSAGGEAVAAVTDVTDEAQCARLVARGVEEFGRIDALVNNAGLGMWARVDEVTDLSMFARAMAGFFDSLRIELRGTGVTVTLVDPGFVGTGAQARNLGAAGVPLGRNPVNIAAVMTPEECARVTVEAAASRKREVVLSARGKIGLLLKLVAPGFVDRLAEAAIARGS